MHSDIVNKNSLVLSPDLIHHNHIE